MNSAIRVSVSAIAVSLMLVGCSSPSVVTLQDGTQYITQDTPRTKTADGFYEFTDIAGKRVRVRAEDVATVKAQD